MEQSKKLVRTAVFALLLALAFAVVSVVAAQATGGKRVESYVAFDSPTGIDIPLNTAEEITVHVQGEVGWANFAFLTECSNGGFAANGSSGTGFSLMTWAYGGLRLDFMNMNGGIVTPALLSYFSSGAPQDGTGQPNADGVNVGDGGAFTFTIRPDEEEGFVFLLEGVEITEYGTGKPLYVALSGRLNTFADEDGMTWLNVSASEGKTGRIYSIVNGDVTYTAEDILRAVNAAPSEAVTDRYEDLWKEGTLSDAISAEYTNMYVTFPGFRGEQKIGLSSSADSVAEADTITLDWKDENTLRFTFGETVREFTGPPRTCMQLTLENAVLSLDGVVIADFSQREIVDGQGRTWLWVSGVSRSDSIRFLSVIQ